MVVSSFEKDAQLKTASDEYDHEIISDDVQESIKSTLDHPIKRAPDTRKEEIVKKVRTDRDTEVDAFGYNLYSFA